MTKYTLKLLKRNKFANIFVVIQISISLMLTIICVSSVISRIGDYIPLWKILSQEGQCLPTNGYFLTEIHDFSPDFTIDDVKATSDSIEDVYGG